MNKLLQNGQVDWNTIEKFDWFQALYQCEQDAVFHAEGNVGIHTKMVVTELLQLNGFQALNKHEQYLLFLAALLHDVAKPKCTIVENGRIRSPRHALYGEKIARQLLWDSDFESRELICSLIRFHGLPIWALDKSYPNKAVIKSSLRLPNHWLYLLSKADVLGRISVNQADFLERVELFKELCIENDCYTQAKKFPNEHSRFKFFKTPTDYVADLYDDTTFEIIILSGIAGSGKDTYANQFDLPIICLDDIRKELGVVKHKDKKGQGQVVQLAYDRAKNYCRKKQSFIWNSTNLTQKIRLKLIQTLAVYKPRFKLVYVETNQANLYSRRRELLKDKVITRMMLGLDMPQCYEVHGIEYHRNGF